MGGHNHWSGIKHKKAIVEAKRGKVFTKIIREIAVAAKIGGGDPGGNPRLRLALEKAREANLPGDTVKQAIQRGTGEVPGLSYEDCLFEGYGPGGVAVLVEATTDNRNRTSGEIRKLFSNHGGSLGEAGCVAWQFAKKGVITVPRAQAEEDALMAVALEAGAEDLRSEGEAFLVLTAPGDLETVKAALVGKAIPVQAAEVTRLPQNTIRVEGSDAERMLVLLDVLEEHEDAQNVYANFDIPDSVIEKVGAARSA